jgi:hypothetical protein
MLVPPDRSKLLLYCLTLHGEDFFATANLLLLGAACCSTCSWWGDWRAYTRYRQQAADGSDEDAADAQPPPLEIDNSSIIDNNSGDLARNLEENCHFVIVTAESWELLHSWYGGGPVVSRPAVLEGLAPSTKRARVMLYPIQLQVIWSGKPTEIKMMEAEKQASMGGQVRVQVPGRCLAEEQLRAAAVTYVLLAWALPVPSQLAQSCRDHQTQHNQQEQTPDLG